MSGVIQTVEETGLPQTTTETLYESVAVMEAS
jgi:hypothetical protein